MTAGSASIEAALPGGAKFRDPDVTADGARRATVSLRALRTLWFNTGTLCNLTCRNCYIESSPTNDRLAYIPLSDVLRFLDEIAESGLPTREIGLTGGEPFMNPDIVPIVEACLERGFSVLVLTNAMRPMMKCAEALLRLTALHGERLTIRVSLDHYARALHEEERGERSWKPVIAGLAWLVDSGFNVHVCARTCWNESEESLRAGFARLFAEQGIRFDAHDPVKLTFLPEMDEAVEMPEITEECWDILGVSPDAMMCATQRMVVKRKGEPASVVSCTLLPYDAQFDLGASLAEASGEVKLNHPHCAKFCVLGGGACSRG